MKISCFGIMPTGENLDKTPMKTSKPRTAEDDLIELIPKTERFPGIVII